MTDNSEIFWTIYILWKIGEVISKQGQICYDYVSTETSTMADQYCYTYGHPGTSKHDAWYLLSRAQRGTILTSMEIILFIIWSICYQGNSCHW